MAGLRQYRQFDCVLIDFYGTICAGDREVVEATCTQIVRKLDLNLSPKQFAMIWGEQFFQMIERCNHDLFQTLRECEQVSLSNTLLALGVETDTRTLVEPLESYWSDPPIHDDVDAMMNEIDLPFCCVSNADTAPLLSAIEKHNLQFDAVISSEDVACYKPQPEIFRAALDKLGVEASRALHVGDSLHSDVGGAAPLGITTVWIERESRIHDIGTTQPDHRIETLTELAGLLTIGP